MSTLADIQSLVMQICSDLDSQIAALNSYKSELDQVSGRISAAISGSNCRFEGQMINQLAATKTKVDETIRNITMARQRLNDWATK